MHRNWPIDHPYNNSWHSKALTSQTLWTLPLFKVLKGSEGRDMIRLKERCLWHCPIPLLTHLPKSQLNILCPELPGWSALFSSAEAVHMLWGPWMAAMGSMISRARALLCQSDPYWGLWIYDEDTGRVLWAIFHSWNIDSVSSPSRNGLKGSCNSYNQFSIRLELANIY